MVRILVTGGNGLVGKYVSRVFNSQNYSLFSFGKETLDVTNFDSVFGIFKNIKPEIVIHLAAITDVDYCEKDPEKAFLINTEGTKNITKLSIEFKCFLVYLSTDFIFDGTKNSPYSEKDIPNPINVYGKSKLLGEEFIIKNLSNYLIVRTSRIFGKNGKNFSSRLKDIMKEKKEIFLTTDIINSPTYALDLANCILNLINKKINGIINVCNNGYCSFYDLGKKIKEKLKLEIKINKIKFEDYLKTGNIARRPKFSVLSLNLLNSLNINMRNWEIALEEFLGEE